MVNASQKITDPFTLEIVKDSLLATGDEMFYALARTAMSPIIYEVLDYASGLTDSKGQLLTQGNGVTGFIGMLSFMVKETIQKFGEEGNLKPGDIIIINDPYRGGGSHLSDVGLVMPIFHNGKLMAFSANKAHWTDVGGKDPGSFTNDANEIFQEGLQFPCVKLFNEGKVNQGIVDMIEANVRFRESIGDMWAQVAALRTGERRVKELCEKYGSKVIQAAIDYLLDHGEVLARKELANLPKGTFMAEDIIETDGKGNGPFPIKVKVTITDDQFICDFRGSHPQVQGTVNCSYTGLVSAVRAIFLAITNPSQDVNDGVFRPLKVIVDPQSIMSAERPVPVSNYFETMLGSLDLIWRALAPYLPERLSAGHHLSVCSVTLTGKHPDTNAPFLIVEPSVGGWGAAEGQDGAPGQFCIADGETYNVPVEVAETRYGIIVDEYSLRSDGAGSGKYVGGSGVIRSYRALTDGQFATITFGRNLTKPWGMKGGQDGSNNQFYVEKANGEIDGPFGVYPRYPLNKGDVIKLITGTGGGYGDPLQRPADQVYRDVKGEYLTVEQARNIYGVEVDLENQSFKELGIRKK
ncbi:hydantoinase B/oxoprolinase family protein [Siminovitchia sp. 179-K 8D1 HS]|uniref:hydantoinase B/oxoprolinase family protein n=1 Tax=Siminovitchia sp. 179-K 8D1 HS TaxID=3142385 RepID=UPI0039A27E4F